MSCQETTVGRQTEFDFLQQLRADPSLSTCCGPLTRIGFSSSALRSLQDSIYFSGEGSFNLYDFNPEVLNAEYLSLEMCTKHWIVLAKNLGTVAIDSVDDDQMQVAYHIFQVSCFSNSWDFKEVLNYAKTVFSNSNKIE